MLWLLGHLRVLSQRQDLNVLHSEEHVVTSNEMITVVRVRYRCAHRLSLWLPGHSDNALNLHLASSQTKNLRGLSPELLTKLKL